MVAAVAVENINIVDLVKLMFQGIGRKYAGDTRVKAASQKSGDSCFFKPFPVSPLPAVLKFCRILRLIVGGIHIMSLRSQAGIHNSQILIGKGQI